MTHQEVEPWVEVLPIPEGLRAACHDHLEPVDSLRNAWEASVASMPPPEFQAVRMRMLRRHAIETGILERLYDVSWGVTEALVAEGITAEAAARAGELSTDVLLVIRDQLEALEYLSDWVGQHRTLTTSLIRQLHVIITRHQPSYEATDALGRPAHPVLRHGEWKLQPNHVRRPDGSLLQYTPPEHVDAQMEALVRQYGAAIDEHPIVRAAWLHHRFIRIHPFEDGNGRVGRALVLLDLLASHYAPLVVERQRRPEYIKALDQANIGDLRPLVRLFAELENVALLTELAPPTEVAPSGSAASAIAEAYVQRLAASTAPPHERAEQAAQLADAARLRIEEWLLAQGEGLAETFQRIDPQANHQLGSDGPGGGRWHYWRADLRRIADDLRFSVDLSEGAWWVSLRLRVLGYTMRYVAAVQKVGRHNTGVLALTSFGRIEMKEGDHQVRLDAFTPSEDDVVTLVHSDELAKRWPEIQEVLERTLAATVDRLGRELTD